MRHLDKCLWKIQADFINRALCSTCLLTPLKQHFALCLPVCLFTWKQILSFMGHYWGQSFHTASSVSKIHAKAENYVPKCLFCHLANTSWTHLPFRDKEKSLAQTQLSLLMPTFYLVALLHHLREHTQPQPRFHKGWWMSSCKYLSGHWPLKQIQFLQLLIQAAFQLLNTQLPFCRGLGLPPVSHGAFKHCLSTLFFKVVIDSRLWVSQAPEGAKCHHLPLI